jgi:hypothetical protein
MHKINLKNHQAKDVCQLKQHEIDFENYSCPHPNQHRISIDIINPLIDEMETHDFCRACREIIN